MNNTLSGIVDALDDEALGVGQMPTNQGLRGKGVHADNPFLFFDGDGPFLSFDGDDPSSSLDGDDSSLSYDGDVPFLYD